MIPGTNLSGTQVLEMYVAYQLLSAAVQSLPTPAENGNKFYAFFYKFLSLIVADFKGFVTKGPPKPLPQSDTKGQ
ncbi:hypothetical protein KGP36_06070 [Patescibacteria group bacterium]|nr:hypothetical protein [Patescibacteria group bacterium]